MTGRECEKCGHVWGVYEDNCHCFGVRLYEPCHNKAGCVKALQDATGCGTSDCQDAMERTSWDHAKAEEHLRKKGTPIGHNEPCLVPPIGWSCSRRAGHEGPCAARPGYFLQSDDLKNTYVTYAQAAEYLRGNRHRRAFSPNETSMRDRQPPLERAAIDNAIAAGKDKSEIEQLRALVREAFNAGYHCYWERGKYYFDEDLKPGDPDGAYWAWWQKTRPGRLDPRTLEFK